MFSVSATCASEALRRSAWIAERMLWPRRLLPLLPTRSSLSLIHIYPETTYEFTYGVVGEADAKARYLEDPAAAADVFSYPDDQIIDLVNADALYEVTRNHDAIVAANSVGSVNAASVGGVLYGYPMTADNGYFLYYDRRCV